MDLYILTQILPDLASDPVDAPIQHFTFGAFPPENQRQLIPFQGIDLHPAAIRLNPRQ
jgi:hypothetical protein